MKRYAAEPPRSADESADRAGTTPADEDPQPDGATWHAHDIDVMPRQKINVRADRQRSLLAAWHLDSGRIVQLGTSPRERVAPGGVA